MIPLALLPVTKLLYLLKRISSVIGHVTVFLKQSPKSHPAGVPWPFSSPGLKVHLLGHHGHYLTQTQGQVSAALLQEAQRDCHS